MRRAASGAQRSGAAAQNLPRLRDILSLPLDNYLYSFFVPRTPARWQQGILWAGWRGRSSPGSLVPNGSGGGTTNRLNSLGSTVPFYGPSRDARLCTAAHAYARTPQNHRTIEPDLGNERNPTFLGSGAVLVRFCRSRANIIRVGYSALTFAGQATPDQGLLAGSARRKFREPGALAAAIGVAGEVVQVRGGNGGFQPFPGCPNARVGTRVSERMPIIVVDQQVAAGLRQPAGLTGDRGGVDLAARGGTPPTARAISPSSPAQGVGRISIDPSVRRGEGRRLILETEMGSGDRSLHRHQTCRRVRTVDNVGRVRGTGASSVSGVDRKRAKLWAGVTRVN